MGNEKLFNDIYLEAEAAKIRIKDALTGNEPLKDIVNDISKFMSNIMSACPYRESKNEKS